MENLLSTLVASNVSSTKTSKKTQKIAQLPDDLKTFVFNDTNASLLVCGGENLPSNHPDAQTDHGRSRIYQVAQKIQLSNGKSYDLIGKDLTVDQLWLLCKVFGAKGAGSMNKFDCRKALAMRKVLGRQYCVGKIVDPKDNDCRHVTYIVLTNALFHSDFRGKFLSINNSKNREDFETGVGSNNKRLWSDIADWINDPTIEDSSKWYPIDDNVYKGHMKDGIEEGLSLDYTSRLTPVSGNVISKMVRNLLKVHNKIDSNMRLSGNHNSDGFAYVDAARGFHHLKTELSAFAAYYFFVVSEQHPAASAAFCSLLPDNMKADSTTAHVDLTTDTDNSSISTTSKRGRPKNGDESIEKLAASATTFFESAAKRTKEDPKTTIEQFDELILRYQSSIMELYKQRRDLTDPDEINDINDMIKESRTTMKDARSQREIWVKKRNAQLDSSPMFTVASRSSSSSINEDVSPLTTISERKRQREEIIQKENTTDI